MIIVTTSGSVRTRRYPAARSRACTPATRTTSPGCGPVAGIGAGEMRSDIHKRRLLTDNAAIHQGAEAGDVPGRAVQIAES
jgi:hypothetical protein